ncbi:hypothetical protein BH24DEI1_BH24DEI1_02100 [soil metagenome]|jgi:hypothetical protein|nr:hypothetical protein [Deinococcota bacterium]
MFTIHDPFMRLAKDRVSDLQRNTKAQRLNQTRYPDRERQPRILFHWTNRA